MLVERPIAAAGVVVETVVDADAVAAVEVRIVVLVVAVVIVILNQISASGRHPQ
jgi:hypothetical protein